MTGEEGERAWILHRYPWSDSSWVVETLSERHGRWALLARAARRQRQARLEPGRLFWLRAGGRGELPTLLAAEELAAPLLTGARQNLLLFYLNELVLRLTQRGDPHPDLFRHYGETLLLLQALPDAHWPLRRFERRLLECLGWAADLAHCAECGRILDVSAWVVPGAGVRCASHRGIGAVALDAASRHWLQGEMDSAPVAEAPLRRYLTAELEPLLGGRPLESRRLFAAYLRHHPLAEQNVRP